MPTATSHFRSGEIVTDKYLQSFLEVSTNTREQCMNLIDLAEANAVSASQHLPLEAQLELSKQQKVLYSYLAQLRGLNRDAILRVRDTKQSTAEARQEIDRLHLQLQNLYYEERHLRGEIAGCESYEYTELCLRHYQARADALDYSHKYQQLPLIPAEKFLEKQPEHAEDDEKTLMFARINHELAEREAFEQERQVLLKKKQTLIAENQKRKDDLASLDQDLEKFIDVYLHPRSLSYDRPELNVLTLIGRETDTKGL
ncbi:MAG: hypothetical protein Q9217_004660 [Psora testacea]